MYLVFTRMPGESYRRPLGSLLLCSCDVFRVLINSLCLLIRLDSSWALDNLTPNHPTEVILRRQTVHSITYLRLRHYYETHHFISEEGLETSEAERRDQANAESTQQARHESHSFDLVRLTCFTPSCLRRDTGGDQNPRRCGTKEAIGYLTLHRPHQNDFWTTPGFKERNWLWQLSVICREDINLTY